VNVGSASLCRDQMGVVDVKVSSGQTDVSKEQNLLVWGLGRHRADERQCETYHFKGALYLKMDNNTFFLPLIFRTKVP